MDEHAPCIHVGSMLGGMLTSMLTKAYPWEYAGGHAQIFTRLIAGSCWCSAYVALGTRSPIKVAIGTAQYAVIF